MAEWRSGRGSLARRVSQGQGDSRFSFPSAFLLIHLSSDSPPVPRRHSDHLFVFLFSAIAVDMVFSRIESSRIPLWGPLCAIIGLLGTVYNQSRNVFPTQYRLQLSKGGICLAPLVQLSVHRIRLQSSKRCPLLLRAQFLPIYQIWDALFRHRMCSFPVYELWL